VYKLVGVWREGINRAVDASGVCMKEIKVTDVCLCVKELEDKIWLLTELFTSSFLIFFGRGRWILGGIVYVGIAHSNQVPSCRNKKNLFIEIVSAIVLLCLSCLRM
jgi:hypothetical protein